MANLDDSSSPATVAFARPAPGRLVVRLAGSWQMEADGQPDAAAVASELAAGAPVQTVAFDAGALGGWDSQLLAFLRRVFELCEEAGAEIDRGGLPRGVRRLLELASAVPEAAARPASERSWLAGVGDGALAAWRSLPETLGFVGEVTLALGRFLAGRASYRPRDLWWTVQQAGVQALPIVGLLSFLTGMILAYVGAVQLRQFGAQIFVADLVGLAVAREMGALMTGIIMAGRTGAAFAAQLGTMQVNEEIDALRTLGVSPTEFLVVPRMLALVAMMPLLCLYADLLGLAGGALVAVAAMDLGLVEFYEQSRAALSLTDFALGLVKATVFGVMVAFAGCFHGIRSGRSSAAVGVATTAAVVTSIVLIVVSDSALTVLFDVLGL